MKGLFIKKIQVVFFLAAVFFYFGRTSSEAAAKDQEEETAPAENIVEVGPTRMPSTEPVVAEDEFAEENESFRAAPASFAPETVSGGLGAPKGKKIPRKQGPKETTLPGGRIKMSGKYRVSFGMDSEDFILNRAHGDWQEKNFRYLFGERLENTFDPGIYDQYLLNLDFSPTDPVNFYTQIVVDPWSWVGSSGEQRLTNQNGQSVIRPTFKYFGGPNSVLNEIYRSNTGDSVATQLEEVQNGQTTSYRTRGFTDFGTRYLFPETGIDFEFRPVRKLWMDANAGPWHVRPFVLADQNQALTSDDPLELSNHKDYWQQSPWLYQYQPIQYFTDRSIKRGYYSDNLSFLARDSEGNRLVLLRGLSVEGDLGATQVAATVAAPFTPWDIDYLKTDNLPGAIRVKHQVTDRVMLGSTYTFRSGYVESSLADVNQVIGVDTDVKINQDTHLFGEVARSARQRDLLSDETIRTSSHGWAYEVGLKSDHKVSKTQGHRSFIFSLTQMDRNFEPNLSRYSNTRDDRFWGEHLSFYRLPEGLEAFRLGDGVDTNRVVLRAQWREKLWKGKFENLFDARNVHKADNLAYKETVLRDEITYRVTTRLTAKAMLRWHGLPGSTSHEEPFLANFYFPSDTIDLANLNIENVAVPADKDPSRFTYSGGLQYVLSKQWTAEGIYEFSNNLPDHPRGLLNDTYRNANDRVDGLLIDHVTTFLYGQGPLGGVPPYEYHSLVRERLIFKPDERVTLTFHAAQNGYKFASSVDDTINHQGVSVEVRASKKMSFFADYTHSRLIDVPRLIASNYTESAFDDHHNVYLSMDYRLTSASVFRAEYGVFGMGTDTPLATPYSTTGFSLPTIDTEQLFRFSLSGDF